MVDIDPYLNMDLTFWKVLSRTYRVIIPVHFAGLPVEADFLYEIAHKYICGSEDGTCYGHQHKGKA